MVAEALAGFKTSSLAVAEETGSTSEPVAYSVRSFDRQWLLPDARLINQPNPKLWRLSSGNQAFLTAPHDRPPTDGPSLTFSGVITDLHHYNGRGGRVFPLWADAEATRSNLRTTLQSQLCLAYGRPVRAEDLFAYIAAVAAHPAYIERFRSDLATPGLRIALTADTVVFFAAAELGRRIVWLHTFGERFTDASAGRDPGAPRLPTSRRPQVPRGGAIPTTPEGMPNALAYDAEKQRLMVGSGFIEPVPMEVWRYQVGGKQVLVQWFNSRKREREKPQIGDRRKPSPLGDIQPDHWLAEYTTELLNVLNVLGLLVELEPQAEQLLERICTGPLVTQADLQAAGAYFPEGFVSATASAQGRLDL